MPLRLGGLGIHNLEHLRWALRMRWLWLQKTEPDRWRHAEINMPANVQCRPKVVTIGEALQQVAHANKAVSLSPSVMSFPDGGAESKGGDKPVDLTDASAIQSAAEKCMTGSGSGDEPGGLATKALQAAETNMKPADEWSGGVAMTRLRDVLGDIWLPGDKVVTREDTEGGRRGKEQCREEGCRHQEGCRQGGDNCRGHERA
ncbi:hypothetical protein PR202_ga28097 [Eleusine coracana subsp. coracana]|uniref:SMP domain-containing protein n=1 Tax=Eleusine coracana subsp. coracana TaxID=191504 RepID=A0AAV5DHQ4_ELECO|nr:hypothetical protein PR202_ga28097 [Eleusine coracana subsp. coracana]